MELQAVKAIKVSVSARTHCICSFSFHCLVNDRKRTLVINLSIRWDVDSMPLLGLSADSTWWSHRMEILSALLASCSGNSPVTGQFPAQRPVTRSFNVVWTNSIANNGDAGDRRGHCAHYDVTVMDNALCTVRNEAKTEHPGDVSRITTPTSAMNTDTTQSLLII